MRRPGERSAPAASNPFGSRSACSTGGKGSPGSNHGIMTSGMKTRFAPSPTGYMHLGHVVNAIYVWGVAGAAGGRVLLRIEDHDRVRSRREYESAILED